MDALGQAGITPSDATDADAAASAIETGESVALDGIDDLAGCRSTSSSRPPAYRTSAPAWRSRRCSAGKGSPRSMSSPTSPIGRYLAQLADESGAIYSVCRGDEPVETKILVDYARDLNFEVICAGKGKNNPLDPYADPGVAAARGHRAKQHEPEDARAASSTAPRP